MTKTKLEIIGPYTPEHEGPFCTRAGSPVDLKIRDGRGRSTLIGYVGGEKYITSWLKNGSYDDTGMSDTVYDVMNAREVPVARDFWINEYACGVFGMPNESASEAAKTGINSILIRTIHVREVLPGDGE
ncbi:hypothetical protein [Novacetimonas hansenii]|uniref:hypothetical protein n=1 Tax=Novacetimonas hansenii TaxID=436 RepID=UPI00248ED945|nr:hypothetical protein [Novacetimonas hansenii]